MTILLNRTIILLCSMLIITGCISKPVQPDPIQSCKSACRGQVQHYEDDLVKCICK